MLKAAYFAYATLFASASLAAATTFGDKVNKAELTPVASILAAPERYLEQQVTVTGTVTAVCEKKHCWMTLANAEHSARFRIKVKDGDMVFPLSAKGKTAYATGVVKRWQQQEGQADSFQLVPSAVEIAD